VAARYDLSRCHRAIHRACAAASVDDAATQRAVTEHLAAARALDSAWHGQLRTLCDGDLRTYADQLVVIGQVGCIHREYHEARHVLEAAIRVNARYVTQQASGDAGDQGERQQCAPAAAAVPVLDSPSDLDAALEGCAAVAELGSAESLELLLHYADALAKTHSVPQAAEIIEAAETLARRVLGDTDIYLAPVLAARADITSLAATCRSATGGAQQGSDGGDGGSAGKGAALASENGDDAASAVMAASEAMLLEALAITRAYREALAEEAMKPTYKPPTPGTPDFAQVENVVQAHGRVLRRFANHSARRRQFSGGGDEPTADEKAILDELHALEQEHGFSAQTS